MKTISLTTKMPSIIELFDMARQNPILIKTQNGESFMISKGDEFETEVDLLRKNHTLLSLLDQAKEEEEISMETVERELR